MIEVWKALLLRIRFGKEPQAWEFEAMLDKLDKFRWDKKYPGELRDKADGLMLCIEGEYIDWKRARCNS